MEIRRCMKCMCELKPGETVCPECGQSYGDWKTEPFALKPGTILDGKYFVGEMLGQGGFGITYIGFDLLLEQKVAIKEYFPMSTGMVGRENRSTVVWSSAMMEKTGVQKGFDSFLKEARKMAKLGGIPGVVGVKSVFIQNETAYIVMDFIEGETLLKKLEREGPMEFDTCVKLLIPIMQALEGVHQHGIIHRDISPDNIMVQKDGRLILLDLGAAKDLDIQGSDGSIRSSQMVAKHGFSPFEQYGRNRKIGPWTDVYAMAATIYYCCTGILPPSAIDRIEEDSLSCQPLLTESQFHALSSCMEIMFQKRPQSMEEMLGIITAAAKTPKVEPVQSEVPKREQRTPEALKQEQPKPEPLTPKPQKSEEKPNQNPPKPKAECPKWLLTVVGIGLIVLVTGLVIFGVVPGILNDNIAGESIAALILEQEPTISPQLPPSTDTAPALVAETVAVPEEKRPISVDGGRSHSVVLYNDGTVVTIGDDTYGQRGTSGWRNIVQISTFSDHTLGLKADGTVVAAGNNQQGQCDVSDWTGIVAVAAGSQHSVGVRSDGTVVAVGANNAGQCDVGDWQNIVAVAANNMSTFGLTAEGKVLCCGSFYNRSLESWLDIVDISVSTNHVVGVHFDGTVSAIGANDQGQCDNMGKWRDIQQVAVGYGFTAGLRAKGTVWVHGSDDHNQHAAMQWTDIVSIGTGTEHILGIQSDGKLVAKGTDDAGQCDVGPLNRQLGK